MTRKKQPFENKEEETVSPKALRKPGERGGLLERKNGHGEYAEVGAGNDWRGGQRRGERPHKLW